MTSTNESSLDVVAALVKVSTEFAAIADSWRATRNVVAASSSTVLTAEERIDNSRIRVGSGNGFRVEWFADCELVDGDAINLTMEMIWHPPIGEIAASVRRVHAQRESRELTIPSIAFHQSAIVVDLLNHGLESVRAAASNSLRGGW